MHIKRGYTEKSPTSKGSDSTPSTTYSMYCRLCRSIVYENWHHDTSHTLYSSRVLSFHLELSIDSYTDIFLLTFQRFTADEACQIQFIQILPVLSRLLIRNYLSLRRYLKIQKCTHIYHVIILPINA